MKKILKLAKAIKLVIFDVDGVLTDGKIYLTEDNIEFKAFNSLDGLGMQLLMKSGIEIGIITARQSKIVTLRMQSIGIKYIYQGNLNKLLAYKDILKKSNLIDNQVAYMGDDLTDLPLMQRVQLAVAPTNAHETVKQRAHYITKKQGGNGAVRELCDCIMCAQNTLDQACQKILNDDH